MLRPKLLTAFFCLVFVCVGSAQQNIVPNPGFERFANAPIGWSYKGSFFGEVVKYWSSATTASPDVYGQGVQVPQDWREKGFGKQKPHSGKSMAGLTLWGCENGKPHCREYIEIQLSEPLVEEQWYGVEFWLAHLDKSLQINNIGAYFSVSEIKRTTDEVLIRPAQFAASEPVKASIGKWVKVSGAFKAKYEGEYLLLGNFSDDEHTQTIAPREDTYNYAYYYIDDVVVKKIPPYLPVPVKSDDLSLIPLVPGKRVLLKNIYFEFDKDELMPRSHVELDKLTRILRDNPRMSIEITGHTDALGDDTYNLALSKRRAQAVVSYLVQQKIAPARLKSQGAGEAQPMESNDTEEGRAKNRRVEFVVLKS
jgi:OmpA-OmpF porin, OOP family